MSDFMKEIKLSNEAYYHWQKIKEEIQSEKLRNYSTNQSTQSIIYAINDGEIANELISLMKGQGLEVITGEEVFDYSNNRYDMTELKHYCEYNFNGNEFVKRETPYIPCIIKW